MKKLTKNIFTLAVVLVLSGNLSAMDFQKTPIQTELQNSILMANDTWDLSGDNSNNQENVQYNNNEKKQYSVKKAILYSALIPGMGEYYVGNKTKARFFFSAEVLTWVGYISFNALGNWKKDDYINLAAEKAGAQLEGKDDTFLDLVGFYDSREQYNTLGRVSDPERPYLYDTPSDDWYWESTQDRMNYREIKNSSKEMYRRRDFMIFAAIANRLISVIDAIRDVNHANRQISTDISNVEKPKYKLAFDPLSYNRQVTITFFPSF